MNIGLIIYGSLEIVTGGFLYDRKLVEYVRSRGDRVEVFSLPWRTYASHLLDNMSWNLVERIKAANLDVLVQDELNHPSLFAMNRRLKSRISCPVISIVHHLRSSELRVPWANTLYSIVEKQYLSTVDGFVFNSHTTRATVEALVGTDRPCIVAYPGRDNVISDASGAWVSSRSTAAGPLRVVHVGSLIPRKNLHTLISALAQVPKELWTLDVVGSLETDPDYVRLVRGIIANNGLESQVKLLGTLTGDELVRYYSESHLLAVPSSYEGFGIVYLEGMGFGLPAVASTTGAAHEIVTHGQDGYLVNPDDVEAITGHIRRLCEDRQLLAAMSTAALESYQRHPTWIDCAEKIRIFLLDMVSRQKVDVHHEG